MRARLELATQTGGGDPVVDKVYDLEMEALPLEGQWISAPGGDMYLVKSTMWVVEVTPLVPALRATPYVRAERHA